MWGLVPAAGEGARIQPLAFSKELLPVGSRSGEDRPKAVSEYLVERLIAGGATKICFVVAPGKSDILQYFGAGVPGADTAFVVQPRPAGLCDALFRAAPLIGPDEPVAIGLPDTVWFPDTALAALPRDRLAFLLFPVARPELFDAVICDSAGAVREVQVKTAGPSSRWIWGALSMPGAVYHALHALWRARGCSDQYLGTLVNAWLAQGGVAQGVRAGELYVDVGTLGGYREAIAMLARRDRRARGAA